MNTQNEILKIKEIISFLENQTIESLSHPDLPYQINQKLHLISKYSKELPTHYRNQNNQIDWDLLDRLAFAKLGNGFTKNEHIELLIENKFNLRDEFEKIKKL